MTAQGCWFSKYIIYVSESQCAPLLSVAHPAPSSENHNPRQLYTMIQNQSQSAVKERATGENGTVRCGGKLS